MKKQLSFWAKRLVGLLLVGAVAVGAVEFKDLNIAIIWNDQTYSDQSPYGWSVGGQDTSGSVVAPEIGKAQVKRLVAAIDPTITIDSSNSLDTAGIIDESFNGSEFSNVNIRIYKESNSTLDLAKIRNDFNGGIISSILYVNGGSITGNPTIYSLLRAAAEDEIGVMIVGSESATEALYIDTTGNVFPVMGVQDTFRFKQYNEDIVTEFDFHKGNNTSEWDIPDTVILKEDDAGNSYIIHYGNNTDIPDTLYKKVSGVVTNNTIYPDDYILVQYGEWSIKAKAVAVIPNDLYAPEMTTGVFNNHDLIVSYDGSKIEVGRMKSEGGSTLANWSSMLWAGGTSIAVGNEVTGISGTDGSDYFTVNDRFIKTVPNITDGTLEDKIYVFKPGTKIAKPNSTEYGGLWDNSDDNSKQENYMDTYLATGYKTLRIDFQNTNAEIFKRVFPTLDAKGVTSIDFEPWTTKGRIKCDADIWAFNEKIGGGNKLGSFDTLYDKSGTFNDSVYYVAYLGNQIAISPGQFVKPPATVGEFDSSAVASRLDSLGFESSSSTDYYKLYHVIGAIQKNHRRLVMLNFQPSYLKQMQNTQDMLTDAIKWISVDDFKLPDPDVYPQNGSNIFTTHDTVMFVVDFKLKGEEIKGKDYTFNYTITYNGSDYTGKIDKIKGSSATAIDTFKLSLVDILDIDSKNTSALTVEFDISIEPKDDKSFDGASANPTLNIYKLSSPTFTNNASDFNGSMTENIVSNTTTSSTDSSGIVGAIINWTLGSNNGSGVSPLDVEVSETGTMTAYASLTGYINSESSSKTYQKNAEGIGLFKAYYLDTNSVPDGYPDLIVVTLTDSTLSLMDEFPNLTTQAIVDSIASDLDLPNNLTQNSVIATDSGLIIYVTDDMSELPNTNKLNDLLKQTLTVTVSEVGNMTPQEIPILDSMAPVIIDADFDPDGNTLIVTFSENVIIPDTYDGIFIFTDFQGKTYTVTGIKKVAGDNPSSTFTFTLGTIISQDGDTTTLKSGDNIQLKGTAKVIDTKGNIQDKDTKKVAIDIDLYPFEIETATFKDTSDTADGFIDLVDVVFDSKTLAIIDDPVLDISLEDVASALTGDIALLLEKKDLSIIGIEPNENGDGVHILVKDNLETPNTADEDDKLADTVSNTIENLAILPTDTVDIIDGVPPVLISVTFDPKDDPNGKDKLTVIFSEVVDNPTNLEDFLIFTDGQITYTMELTLISDPNNTDTFIYEVTGIKGKTYPEDGDLVQLKTGSGITDKNDNTQDKATDPIAIDVGDYINQTDVGVIGPFDPDDPIDPLLIDYIDPEGKTEISTGNGTGTVVLVDITGAILEGDVWRGELWIYDAVGNEVAKNLPGEHTITQKGEHKIAAHWDGTNETGRIVGTANYIGFMKVYKKGINDKKEKEISVEKLIIGVATSE